MLNRIPMYSIGSVIPYKVYSWVKKNNLNSFLVSRTSCLLVFPCQLNAIWIVAAVRNSDIKEIRYKYIE